MTATLFAVGTVEAVTALREQGYTVHPPGQTCQLPPVQPGARFADPTTSHEAAARALPKARTVAFALLEAFQRDTRYIGQYEGLTRDEVIFAARAAARHWTDIPDGAWRRVSELRSLGLIEPVVGVTRPGKSGCSQQAYRITDAGRAYISATRDQR